VRFVKGRGNTTQPPGAILRAIKEGVPLIGHNAAEFDRLVWDKFYPGTGAVWFDSMPRCRRRGLPGGLDKIGQMLFSTGKHKDGQQVLRLLSRPQGKGPFRGKFVEPDKYRLSALARYCATDVFLNAAIWRDECLGHEHTDDLVLAADRAINDRGIAVDLDLAAGMLKQEHENAARLAEASRVATNGVMGAKALRSQPQTLKWLKENYSKSVKNCTSLTLGRILDNTDDPVVKVVVQAKIATSKITAAKIEAVIHRSCLDGRLRGATVYHGAHTGRWSHRGAQLGNLPKVKIKIPEFVYAHPNDAPAVFADEKDESIFEVLGSMLRGIFAAPKGRLIAVVDYSAVEARGTHWIARNKPGLVPYEKGLDAYRVVAAEIFGMRYEDIEKPSSQRDAGKIAVLACGYQGGPDALTNMASKMNVDLEAAGVTAVDVVNGWRDANVAIAGRRKGKWRTPEGKLVVTRQGGLWKEMKKAVERIAKGESRMEKAGRCTWLREGRHMICVLPSGRRVQYRNIDWEKVDDRWGGRTNSITFESNRGGFRVPTYGGKLTENVVQAVSRDLLGDAMVRIGNGEAGKRVRIVLHVHDELVVEVAKREAEESLAKIEAIMRDGPAWAKGFPIDVDGAVGKRYTKP